MLVLSPLSGPLLGGFTSLLLLLFCPLLRGPPGPLLTPGQVLLLAGAFFSRTLGGGLLFTSGLIGSAPVCDYPFLGLLLTLAGSFSLSLLRFFLSSAGLSLLLSPLLIHFGPILGSSVLLLLKSDFLLNGVSIAATAELQCPVPVFDSRSGVADGSLDIAEVVRERAQ